MSTVREQLAERASHLTKLLDKDMEALSEIYNRWDSDRMADEEIAELYNRIEDTLNDAEHARLYPNVSGIWTHRDGLLTEVKQAFDRAKELQNRLQHIADGAGAR